VSSVLLKRLAYVGLVALLLGASLTVSACTGKSGIADHSTALSKVPAAQSASATPPLVRPALPTPIASTAVPPQGTGLPRSLTTIEKSRRVDSSLFLMKQEITNSSVRENVIKLRTELYARQYDLLDSQLDGLVQKATADSVYDLVERDLESFTDNHSLIGLPPVEGFVIDAWVKAKPNSAWSHLASASQLIGMAAAARGEHFADQVSTDQWAAMGSLDKKARVEVEQALKLNPKIVMAWVTLFQVDQFDGGVDDVERDYAVAEKQRSNSILIEDVHENAIEPRWDGSYEMMDGVARAKLADLKKNPRFWDLQGDASADMGYGDVDEHCTPCDTQQWESSLKDYNDALAYEDDANWLSRAGDAAVHLHRYGLAYAYYQRAITYMPRVFEWNAESQLMRALCDPNFEADKFEALKQDATLYAGVEVMEYPRTEGDCTYYQAELPWGDQPVANAGSVKPYVIGE
jgi:hypothetical protein